MARRKTKWLWVALFVWMALLLVILATGWNLVLVQDYRRMVALAHQLSVPGDTEAPWLTLTLGTLGFVAALGTIALFFIKVLKEMRLNQIQSEFLATVSHELKTPIAAIELSASLLREGGLSNEEVKRLWASHQAELKRLHEEVNTLLEAARLEARELRPKNASIELETWIGQSLSRWNRILGPGSRLRREGEPLPVGVRVDLRTLDLIADNLVDNARKFSRESPELVVVTRRVPKRGLFKRPRWLIEFRDRGWGFDPSDSRRIFGRFFRGRTDAPYSIPGSGLGLYLAESGSRALGITLRATSLGVGQGAVFTLEGREE